MRRAAGGGARRAKRALDVTLAAVGLVVLAPLLALIAGLIRAGDGGPVLFRHGRIGLGGRPFRMLKFRTMVVDAERRGGPLTAAGDRRVTPVGALLRGAKLDELPQLWNVLRGEMSLVGPRPEVARYVERYTETQRAVLDLTPGLTDPASLAFLDEEMLLARAADPEAEYVATIMPEKIRRNLAYAARATVWTDLGVMGLTLGTVFRRCLPPYRGAGAALRSMTLLRHRRWLIVGLYALGVPFGYVAAFLLRFDFALDPEAAAALLGTLPALAALRLVTYWRFRLFRGYWQHFGLYDLLTVVKAATVSSVLFAAGLAATGALGAVPRSVVLLDWMLAVVIVGGMHFVARCGREGGVPWRVQPGGRRALIVGAGEAAERLLRQFRHDVRAGVRVVGLVDDDPRKIGRVLHGVPVLGGTARLGDLVALHAVDLLVIAMPSASPDQKREVVARCMATGAEFRVMRPLQEVVEGRAPLSPLRPVQIEDLLGRAPVQLDMAPVAEAVTGRVVLITGGAGSIGSELARQVARLSPARLVLVEHAETPLYYTHLELARDAPELDVVPVTATITDEAGLRRVFEEHRPHLVFHAAAYKHVPMMEENVLAAVRNNVLGTYAAARCAAECGAATFVLLSTDKAVHPSSVMGATKRIAERLVLELPALRGSRTEFRAVRFGNVLGSDGSVIPLFRRQLDAGGPLTVTHPDVTRYFMTVQEAVQLVLQSVALSEAAGRVAMLDMGEPVRIVELAENLIRLSGREPYGDVQIVFTGLRPGEKLAEALVSSSESGVPTAIDKIRVVHARPRGEPMTEEQLGRLAGAVTAGAADAVLRSMRALVPECVTPLRDRGAERERPVRVPAGVPVPGAGRAPALPAAAFARGPHLPSSS